MNSVPFMRTSREFPKEIGPLVVQIDKAYLDTANAVNARTVGVFATQRQSSTGEKWFIDGIRSSQTIRQVYTFSAAGNIAHGIDTTSILGFSRIYGTFTDGSSFYPLPYVDVTSSTNQINITVDSTNIVITAGGGSPPSITSGYLVLEWISF